jgi:hypothetical protein
MTEFLTYTKLYTDQEAQEFARFLEESKIEFKIEVEKDLLDKVYIGESFDPFIAVKIPQNQFEELNKILLRKAQSELNDINPDYYVFNFTDSELIEVLKNPNEWNHLDQALAQKLLTERKIEISAGIENPNSLQTFTPYRLETSWILAEYLVSILFAFVGIMIGAFTLFAYKTLKSGNKVNMYDKTTRMHASIMIGIGILRTLYHYIYLVRV